MTVADILIIYLAFGAPIAVYKYLQSRELPIVSRYIATAATFLFWIPAAVRICYLYLSNAYFGYGFVSPVDLDSSDRQILELRDSLRSELVRLGAGAGMHDVCETVERYVGLTAAVREPGDDGSIPRNFLEAAGRTDVTSAVHCINRRNRRRLERHHIQSRKDLLKLFSDAADSAKHQAAVREASKLARELDDFDTVEILRELAGKAEVWSPEQKNQSQSQSQSQSLASIPIPAIGSLNGD